MIQFPHCKINLGLSILSKRQDGFHNLESVFYPIPIKDMVEITPAIKGSSIPFSNSGLPIPGNMESNLCLKAFQSLKVDFPFIPDIQMHLHKIIPMGAGLGGGSSDGTSVLMMLNSLFKLQLSDKQLENYALQLGSDCPFFLKHEACHVTGKGETLHPIKLDLSIYTLALIHPNIHINTKWAFQQVKPCIKEKLILNIIQQPISTWKQELINDFESAVLKEHTIVGAIKNEFYEQGALYASMTGTGSSVYGIFEKDFKFQHSALTQSMRIDIF